MTPADLREWLEGHTGDIFTFMDYEATLQDDDEFRDEPSSVTDVVSSALEDGDEEALEALERYRVAYTERFGPAPALSELLTGLGELNDEFRGWIETDA